MALQQLDNALARELEGMREEGRAKAPERAISGYLPAEGTKGPGICWPVKRVNTFASILTPTSRCPSTQN